MQGRAVALGGLVVAVVAAATGCGGDSSDSRSGGGGEARDGGSGAEPTALVGETEQGLHIRIDPEGDGRVRLRFPATCRRDDRPGEDVVVSLHRHPLTVEVADDGGFEADEEYVEDGTDGDEEHVAVHVEGTFTDDGTASGTLEVTSRWWGGQSQDFSPDCGTGSVAWTADRPPTEGDDTVVPLAASVTVAAAGPDLVARDEAGGLLLVDAAAGEVRGLDGPVRGPVGPDDGGDGGADDPSVPSTVVAGGAGVAAPGVSTPPGPTDLAVVAGGVWTGDPATGVVTRFELDGGAATATIDRPVDQLVAGPDALWTVSTNAFRTGWTLDRRDPTTGDVQVSVPVNRGGIAAGPRDVWYAHGTLAGGLLSRVDPATLALGEPYDVEIPQRSEELVPADDRIWWIAIDGLTSIDLATGQVGVLELPSDPDAIGADASGVWTMHEQEAVLRRIEGDAVVRTVDIPDGWWDVAVTDDGAVWLAGRGPDGDEPRAIRLDPTVTGR